MNKKILTIFLLLFIATPLSLLAQEDQDQNNDEENEEPVVEINLGDDRQTFLDKTISFDASDVNIPEDASIEEIVWNFGDGVRTTGDEVSHAYTKPGTYEASVTLSTSAGQAEDSVEIQVFEYVATLVADNTIPEDQIALRVQQAAANDLHLVVLRAKGSGPEVLIEEELSRQLIDSRDAISKSNLIITWTSGSVGANALSKYAQHIRQADELSLTDLNMASKGVITLSETPIGALSPNTQSAYDQLEPAYVLITRPQALELLITEPLSADAARGVIFESPIEHRVLGSFSARTVRDLGVTNFMSFGINYLVNHGVAINSITLILMLPIIATILSFSRQVIGIKAFGIITPAMTALSFLVIGLQFGLIVFSAVLLSGTVTRLIVRKLHLLYLPRMALVLTSVSLAILVLLGLGIATDDASTLSFSIFPVLILTLLAEEFISVQFSSGARRALTITAWTLLLSIACYFIVSWELLRTVVLSYPEVTLLAIPINIIIGRWSGLRLTEYFRFRQLFRQSS